MSILPSSEYVRCMLIQL